MNPKVVVDLDKLKMNIEFLTNKIKQHHLSITAVTKVYSADPRIIAVFEQFPEIEYFGDSRIENLKSYQTTSKKKILLRIPMLSEIKDVLKVADISFHSEIATLKQLNAEAKKQKKHHQVLLMVDLGDLREGFFEEAELMRAVEALTKMEQLQLIGLGVNLTCYGGIIPEAANLNQLIRYQKQIEQTFKLPLPMISGGNSSSLYLLDQKLPQGITNLRIGEAYLLGRETAFATDYQEMFQDVFTLCVEIIELKKKPSYPVGKIGMDAFGQVPTFVDRGVRLRGILGIGKQDIPLNGIIPDDPHLKIIGASSDHLMLDFTESLQTYQVGDEVKFRLDYSSLLAAFTSKYVKKEYVGGDAYVR